MRTCRSNSLLAAVPRDHGGGAREPVRVLGQHSQDVAARRESDIRCERDRLQRTRGPASLVEDLVIAGKDHDVGDPAVVVHDTAESDAYAAARRLVEAYDRAEALSVSPRLMRRQARDGDEKRAYVLTFRTGKSRKYKKATYKKVISPLPKKKE